jgi:hypothetical protein
MARNLYEMGDQPPELTGEWLNERDEKRSRLVPVGMVLAAIAFAGAAVMLAAQILPADGKAPEVQAPMSIDETFALCDGSTGQSCVLSADRYSYHGRTYRLTGMQVPNLEKPRCKMEADRAVQARRTLAILLNGGVFDALADPSQKDPDVRILTRDGVSIGQLMILKGQARSLSDGAINWCAGTKS